MAMNDSICRILEIDLVIEGPCWALYSVDANNGLSDFVSSLDKTNKNKIKAVCDNFVRIERWRNEERCSFLEDGLYELKAHQVRLVFFYDGKYAIITHGFLKKRPKTPRNEIDKAKKLRADYFERKGKIK